MWADSLREYRYLFFTGKGGVGKTSLSCATAFHLAAQPGKRVLLVSTDPASNLDEVLEQPLGPEPRPVTGIANLWAMNIDPIAAADAFREKAVAPYRGILPEASLRSIAEQFSGACTTEIAAFNEFTRLLTDATSADFDHIVFDTAPTGHTLRLLSLPAAWTDFIDTSKSGISCVGPLSQLQDQAALYHLSLAALQDEARTMLVLVARADTPSLKEAARSSAELREIGIQNQRLIVNGVFMPADSEDATAIALAQRARKALSEIPEALSRLPMIQVPLLAKPVVGKAVIARLLHGEDLDTIDGVPASSEQLASTRSFASLLEEIAERGHGVILTMGKGGVGKTTLAVSAALHLAERGHEVLLTTTDPAAHLSDTIAGRAESLRGKLSLERIDPALEVEAYRTEVLATVGASLDADGRALLEEDLRSPCTEEIAVFRAFARAVDAGAKAGRFVVMDTAPTGHTVLLLDAAEAYHREVLRTQMEMPESVRTLLPRLRDPNFAHVLVVTLAEPTPVHEAGQLQDDLRRAGIEPFAWIVNQSFAASGTQDPLLRAKANQEIPMIAEVERTAKRMTVLPWRSDPLMAESITETFEEEK